MTLRYPFVEREPNAILDVARTALRLRRIIPDFTPGDVIQHLANEAGEWSWSLIDIIMDYEERDEKQAALVRKFRRIHPRKKHGKKVRPSARKSD